jgi:hypothetical protein
LVSRRGRSSTAALIHFSYAAPASREVNTLKAPISVRLLCSGGASSRSVPARLA